MRERERGGVWKKREKKKIVYLANRPVYTLSNMHPSISNARARKDESDVKKEQRPIGDITDITLVRWRWRGGRRRRSVCDEIDGTEVFIGGGTTHSVEHNTGCTYALINHRLDAPPVSQVNPCKLLNEGPVSLPNSIFQAEVSR